MQKAALTNTVIVIPSRLAHEQSRIAARTGACVVVDGGANEVYTVHI